MLDTFGIGQGGTQYRRLVAAFERIFGATIFFGTDSRVDTAAVFQQVRFNFMSEARLWYWRNGDQQALPEMGEDVVVLSPEFYQEIITHPIPTDLQAARALSGSPAALDLYNWLSYRCHIAKREERVPLFWGVRTDGAVGNDELRPAAQVSGAAGTMAAACEPHVA
jgi:hypothetical protein